MKTNGKKGQTAGFRAAAVLAVLGTTVVMAAQPDVGVRASGEAVSLDEVVLVSKTNVDPDENGKGDRPAGVLLDGGGGKGGGLLGALLGGLGLLG